MKDIKVLVVYYSFEGNTRFIAETVASEVNADLLELKPVKEIQGHGFMKYIWGGRQVVLKTKPELVPFEQKPEEYDLIFIGTPVWAFTFAPPLNTFLSDVHLSGKKIALFCCDEGGLGKTFTHFTERLTGNQIISQMEFLAPLKKEQRSSAAAAREWAGKVIEMATNS